MDLSQLLTDINDFVWGPIMLALLVGTGIFLTIRLKFLPWRNLIYAVKMITQKKTEHEGDLSPFQSLMTALSATVGTGNIVGVATAMVLGGPGAIVWMWISAAFGLSTKYGESVLAVKYRETNSVGEMAGGPMYAMKNGIGGTFGKIMAAAFAFFAVCASFGIGNMTQANSISAAFESTFGWESWITGIILVVASLAVLMRGVHSIGAVSSFIVPSMAFFYLLFTFIIIIVNFENIPGGLAIMFQMAFSTDAVAGGVGGSIVASMLTAMRWGVARGVFSNEAGLGSAPIAAAAARTDHASRQGYVNMTGTFFDTMIICMLTGLVIASSGVLGITDPETGKLVSATYNSGVCHCLRRRRKIHCFDCACTFCIFDNSRLGILRRKIFRISCQQPHRYLCLQIYFQLHNFYWRDSNAGYCLEFFRHYERLNGYTESFMFADFKRQNC